MENNNSKESNWFDAPEYENNKTGEEQTRLPKFNITLEKGEIARSEEIIFLDTGYPIDNQYGKSIIFKINHKGADFVWFIKSKSYSLLKEIRREIKRKQTNGKDFVGTPAKVTRAGTNQTDTRWTITF